MVTAVANLERKAGAYLSGPLLVYSYS